METKCQKCGGRTYTWGMPLPGQSPPSKGAIDQRERDHRTCVLCGNTVKSGWQWVAVKKTDAA